METEREYEQARERDLRVERERQVREATARQQQAAVAQRLREIEAAKDAADQVAAAHERQEVARLIGLVLATGREIWRSSDEILISPRLSDADPACKGLVGKLVALKFKVLALLPTERQGPQRI